MKVLTEAIRAYTQNIKWISIFSLAFLITLPIMSFLPSFVSAGATFLRFGSIPTDLNTFDLTVMGLLFIISLFFISFAIVGINLIVKSQRTVTNVRQEVINNISLYVASIFWGYLILSLTSLFFDIFFFERGMHTTLGILSSFVIWVFAFFYANAVVIDEMKPYPALFQSVRTISSTLFNIIIWLFIGTALVLISDLVALAINTPVLGLLLNAVLILPFLTVLQIKIYIQKYQILG